MQTALELAVRKTKHEQDLERKINEQHSYCSKAIENAKKLQDIEFAQAYAGVQAVNSQIDLEKQRHSSVLSEISAQENREKIYHERKFSEVKRQLDQEKTRYARECAALDPNDIKAKEHAKYKYEDIYNRLMSVYRSELVIFFQGIVLQPLRDEADRMHKEIQGQLKSRLDAETRSYEYAKSFAQTKFANNVTEAERMRDTSISSGREVLSYELEKLVLKPQS